MKLRSPRLRILSGAAALLAILACGPARQSTESTGSSAAADGPRHRCQEAGACTEYTVQSRMGSLGLDYFRESCLGQWANEPCARAGILSACHVVDHEGWRDVTFVHYPGGDIRDLGEATEYCTSMGGELERGQAAVQAELVYPSLSIDGDWVSATMEASDYVPVQTMEGAAEQPYDVFRIELVAGETYTVYTRHAPEPDGLTQDIDGVREIDPNGHDHQAICAFGAELERGEHDAIMGNEFESARYVARRTGPHALIVSAGFFGSEGPLERVYMGPYDVRVLLGEHPTERIPE